MSLKAYRAGLKTQTNSLSALLIRDMMSRYGREQLGFLWVVLEPMILTVGVMGMWSLLKGSYEHGVRIVEFVLTGYMVLTLWRHLTNPMTLLLRRSIPLLNHRRISVLDVFFSRSLQEFAGTTCALAVVLSTLLLIGLVSPVEDWSLLIFGWILMGAIATGVGAIILFATERNEAVERFIQPIQYLLVPLSGTFFLVAWLPDSIQRLVLLNPMVHTFEMVRAGFFGESVETHFSASYALIWALVLNCVGLSLVSRLKRDLQIS